MELVRGAPHYPQTQGKIERWHQTMKNRIFLGHYFLPGDLKRQIAAFIDCYNNHRYHESLANLTSPDVYHGRGAQILKMRKEIKTKTIQTRRLQHQKTAAYTDHETESEPPLRKPMRSQKNSDDVQFLTSAPVG